MAMTNEDFDYLAPLAAGLNLHDADDRAIFRVRAAEHMQAMRVDVIREWLPESGNETRAEAVRAVADACIAYWTAA